MIDSALLIVIGALITASLCAIAWLQRRGHGIYISSVFLLAMGLGSMGIAAFYTTIIVHGVDDEVVFFSRVLWAFILLMTALIALSVVTRKNGKPNGK